MTRKFRLWRCTALIWSCLYFVRAGPVERSVRVVREVYPEIEPEKVEGNQAQVCIVGDVVYGADEAVPADQSCFRCKCQPPGVHCEITRCVKKPGCRAIHKPNSCCPDYQCECEHEGKSYANGERLETTPGGECKVCYCRGGEVQCAEVSCYIRTDCEGRTVSGQCCPKYEHCPPIEPTLDKIALKPDLTETKSNAETTTRTSTDLAVNNTSIENEIGETTTSYHTQENPPNEKQDTSDGPEVTAAAEIDVVIKHTEETNENTRETNDNTRETNENSRETNENTRETSESTREATEEHRETEDRRDKEPQQITIHEIIPQVKEIPMTEPPKQEAPKTLQGQLLVEETVPPASNDNSQDPIIEDANDLGFSDSDLESSEVSEVFQHPPPVLRVGDQLLFLKKGEFVSDNDASTPSPVFTIIGAEGLQRGDIDSVEHHEVIKEEVIGNWAKIPNESTTEHKNAIAGEPSDKAITEEEKEANETNKDGADKTTNVPKREVTTGKILVEELAQGKDNQKEIQSEASKEKAAEVQSRDKSEEAQSSTIQATAATESSSSVENSTIDVAIQLATVESDAPSNDSENVERRDTNPIEEIDQNPTPAQNIPVEKTTEEADDAKSKSEEINENPAYPPIPDIMSQQERDELPENLEQTELELSNLKEVTATARETSSSRILPDILTIRNNHTIPENITNSEWLKMQDVDAEPLVNEGAALPAFILQQMAPSDQETSTDNTESATISGNNEVDEEKDVTSSESIPSTGNPNSEDLLNFGIIIDSDSVAQNQIKKLAEEDDNTPGETIRFEENQPQTVHSRPEENIRSTETLEDTVSQESGENTTPKNKQEASLTANEDASVEMYQKDSEEYSENVPNLSIESEKVTTVKSEARESEVEMIDLHLLQSNTTSHVAKRNVTHEEEEVKKSGDHLENYDPQSDKIFQELDDEIQLRGTSKRGEEENKEAEVIFKELLDEVNSSSTTSPNLREGARASDKESVVLQRVSDAIAKFQLKDARQSLDSSIIGILRDFFSSQYRSYKDK